MGEAEEGSVAPRGTLQRGWAPSPFVFQLQRVTHTFLDHTTENKTEGKTKRP